MNKKEQKITNSSKKKENQQMVGFQTCMII